MPSFDRRESLLKGVVLAAVVLLIFGAAELSVRWLAAENRLPSPEALLWHRPEVDIKLRQIDNLKSRGPVFAAFAGSSLAYSGIDPVVFDREFQAQGKGEIRSYNIGLAAMSLGMNERFFERVFYRKLRPQVLFWIVSPRDINQNNPISKGVDVEALSSPYGEAILGQGPRAWLTRNLLTYSQFYRYRRVLMISLLNGFRFPSSLPTTFDTPKFESSGYVRNDYNLGQRLAAGEDSDPKKVAKQNLLHFDPNGQNADALVRLAEFCRQNGVELVLVNMPLTSYMMAGFTDPAAEYQRYLDVISQISRDHGVLLLDVNTADLRKGFDDTDYGDMAHLNISGANKFSALLARLYAQAKP
jgi:hypothetical protein